MYDLILGILVFLFKCYCCLWIWFLTRMLTLAIIDVNFSQLFFSVKERFLSLFNASSQKENAVSEKKFKNVVEVNSMNYSTRKQKVIIAKILEFSNGRLHLPNQVLPELARYDVEDDWLKQHYLLKVYADGCDISNQGYVSIVFSVASLPPGIVNFQMTCIVSLIDADGELRFPQTYTFAPDPPYSDSDEAWSRMSIERYISRNTLLSEASKLLPCDTLTLHIDFTLRLRVLQGPISFDSYPLSFDMQEFFLKDALKTEGGPDGTRYFLVLNTTLYNHLVDDSDFFRQLLTTPMKEQFTGRMELSREEYYTFRIIGCLMCGVNSVTVNSVDDIIQLYIVCEKYNLQEALRHSIHLLVSCLSPDNVDDISELADMFNDEYLKMTVTMFRENENENIKALLNYCLSLCPPVNGKWFCKILERESESFLKFDLLKNDEDDDEEETFDFYH